MVFVVFPSKYVMNNIIRDTKENKKVAFTVCAETHA